MAAPAAGFTDRFQVRLAAQKKALRRRNFWGFLLLTLSVLSALTLISWPFITSVVQSPVDLLASWLGSLLSFWASIDAMAHAGVLLFRIVPGFLPGLYLDPGPVCGVRLEPVVGLLVDQIYQVSARSITMKTVLRFASVLLLAILIFLPLQSAGATNGAFEGQVVFGQSFTLKSGDTMNGDLLVFGGSATIEEGATVNGSVVLFGGNLTVNGTVNGDVAITGGSASLGAAAHITGNLTTVAASLDRAEGSQVDGQIYNTATSWIGNGENSNIPQLPVVKPPVPVGTGYQIRFQPALVGDE